MTNEWVVQRLNHAEEGKPGQREVNGSDLLLGMWQDHMNA
jgi:hypothetical protein